VSVHLSAGLRSCSSRQPWPRCGRFAAPRRSIQCKPFERSETGDDGVGTFVRRPPQGLAAQSIERLRHFVFTLARLQSNLSPRKPKHYGKPRSTRDQRTRRINNLQNPTESAKPPSPVQILAAPPIQSTTYGYALERQADDCNCFASGMTHARHLRRAAALGPHSFAGTGV
jgi:hypothetical protein